MGHQIIKSSHNFHYWQISQFIFGWIEFTIMKDEDEKFENVHMLNEYWIILKLVFD